MARYDIAHLCCLFQGQHEIACTHFPCNTETCKTMIKSVHEGTMWCDIMQEASLRVEDDSLRKTGFWKVITGFRHEAFSVLLSAVAKGFKERA